MYTYSEFKRISIERTTKLESERAECERKELVRLIGLAQPYISAFEKHLDLGTTTIHVTIFTDAFRAAKLPPLNNEQVAKIIANYFNELGWGVDVIHCASPDPEIEYQIGFFDPDE